MLHNFAGSDGTSAWGLIQATDGNFYGVTGGGGSSKAGVVFKITPGGTYTVLHNLNGTTDGISPYSSLIQATDGNFYGVANGGRIARLWDYFQGHVPGRLLGRA